MFLCLAQELRLSRELNFFYNNASISVLIKFSLENLNDFFLFFNYFHPQNQFHQILCFKENAQLLLKHGHHIQMYQF